MSDITLEKILEEARSLSPEDRLKLVRMLIASETKNRPRKTLEQIAGEQGKKPMAFAEIRRLGEFFPQDESVDDLVSSVQEWRRDSGERRLD